MLTVDLALIQFLFPDRRISSQQLIKQLQYENDALQSKIIVVEQAELQEVCGNDWNLYKYTKKTLNSTSYCYLVEYEMPEMGYYTSPIAIDILFFKFLANLV